MSVVLGDFMALQNPASCVPASRSTSGACLGESPTRADCLSWRDGYSSGGKLFHLFDQQRACDTAPERCSPRCRSKRICCPRTPRAFLLLRPERTLATFAM